MDDEYALAGLAWIMFLTLGSAASCSRIAMEMAKQAEPNEQTNIEVHRDGTNIVDVVQVDLSRGPNGWEETSRISLKKGTPEYRQALRDHYNLIQTFTEVHQDGTNVVDIVQVQCFPTQRGLVEMSRVSLKKGSIAYNKALKEHLKAIQTFTEVHHQGNKTNVVDIVQVQCIPTQRGLETISRVSLEKGSAAYNKALQHHYKALQMGR